MKHYGRDAEHTAHDVRKEGFKQGQRRQYGVEGRQQPRWAQLEQDEQHDRARAQNTAAPAVSRLQMTPGWPQSAAPQWRTR